MSGKTDSPVPPAYARWCRVDFPGLTDSVITERWRQDSDAEHEFWAAIAAQDARPADGTAPADARKALEKVFRETFALHLNDFRAKFEKARDAVMGAADAYAQAVAQADLLSRLRTVLLDLRTNPTEARIQALHLLDTAASPPAGVQSAPDDALFWAWMDAYVDEPHNAEYEVPDMQRAFEGGMQAARDQATIAAQDARPASGPDLCECGHYWAHHAFSDDVCAVADCPCTRPRPAPELAAADHIIRDILESLCRRDGLSLESTVVPGEPARNYELVARLGIGHVFGLKDVKPQPAPECDDSGDGCPAHGTPKAAPELAAAIQDIIDRYPEQQPAPVSPAGPELPRVIDITGEVLTAAVEGKRILLQLGGTTAPKAAPELAAAMAALATEMHAEAQAVTGSEPDGMPDLTDHVRAQVLHEYASRIRQALQRAGVTS